MRSFDFADFRAYFGPFSHVNRVEHKNLSPNFNLLSITGMDGEAIFFTGRGGAGNDSKWFLKNHFSDYVC